MRNDDLQRNRSTRAGETPGRKRGFRRRGRAGGFTLLEVMLAASLLAVAVLGVAAAQIGALKLSRESSLRAQAMFLAEQQIEAFQSMSATNLVAVIDEVTYPDDSTNPIDPIPGDGDPTTFNRSWDISVDDPETDVITITVNVVWTNSLGVSRTVTLRTMKAS